jgi:hypothetical protein
MRGTRVSLAAGALASASSAALASVVPFSSGSAVTISGPNAGTYLTPTLVPTDPAAVADDPALANSQTFDIQVSISAGDHWAAADMRAQLYGNVHFYIPPTLDSNIVAASTQRNAIGTRYLRDDTFVAAPALSTARTTLLGSSSRKTPPDQVFTFPSNGSNFVDQNDPNGTALLPANDQMLVDISWCDATATSNTVTGVQTIARLTILTPAGDIVGDPTQSGIFGYIAGKVTGINNPGTSSFYTFVLQVPEPATMMLMLGAVGAMAWGRRRSTTAGGDD